MKLSKAERIAFFCFYQTEEGEPFDGYDILYYTNEVKFEEYYDNVKKNTSEKEFDYLLKIIKD